MTTPIDFAYAVLQASSLPTSRNNLVALVAWQKLEGGHFQAPTFAYNPLNTTQPMPGGVSRNSAGVKAYSSWPEGLAATVQTLHNGFYKGILASLAASQEPGSTLRAVDASPWGTHNVPADASGYAESAFADYGNAPDPIGGSLPTRRMDLPMLLAGLALVGGLGYFAIRTVK
jgi:hypothetical protein